MPPATSEACPGASRRVAFLLPGSSEMTTESVIRWASWLCCLALGHFLPFYERTRERALRRRAGRGAQTPFGAQGLARPRCGRGLRPALRPAPCGHRSCAASASGPASRSSPRGAHAARGTGRGGLSPPLETALEVPPDFPESWVRPQGGEGSPPAQHCVLVFPAIGADPWGVH